MIIDAVGAIIIWILDVLCNIEIKKKEEFRLVTRETYRGSGMGGRRMLLGSTAAAPRLCLLVAS